MNPKLYVKHFHCIPPSYGGVSVYVKRLSLALTKNGFPSGAYYAHRIEGIPEHYRFLYDRYPKHIRSLFVLTELSRLLKSVRRYRLIHGHASLNSSFAIWIIHKLLHLPVVYTVHNQMIEQEFQSLNRLDRWCVKSLAADNRVQYVAVSQEGRKKLLNLGFFFNNDIRVIPAYIKPVEIGEPSDYLADALFDFIEGKPYILFYAQSFREYEGKDVYGVDSMVEAFIQLRHKGLDISLVLCIAEPNNTEKVMDLKRIIHEHCLDKFVFWQLGAIIEMWPLIKKAKLYVRPTSTDGDSVLVREVLSFGIPVLASDVCLRPQLCAVYHFGNTSELVDKAYMLLESGPFVPSNHNDFYESIFDVYSSLISFK